MILSILGLILFGASFGMNGLEAKLGKTQGVLKAVGLMMIAIGIMFSCFVIIPAGQVGVKTLFGKVSQGTLTSGLQFVNPLVDVTEFDVRTQNYTMSVVHDEGKKQGDDAIRVLSKDGLEVILDVSVLYRIIPEQAPNILKTIGSDYEEKIIRPLSRTRIRDNAVYYDAVSLFSDKRDEFQNKIFSTIEKDFKLRGLVLEQLLLRNIILPASVKTTIESKINAEQDAQKMTFVLDKEKQEAERKRVEAQGIADYQRIINTGLSDNQLRYEMIKAYKELATSQNAKVIIMGDGKNPVILGGN
ncbi:MAG: prohibitin family protein [Bacteroidia bacterium]